MADKKKSPAKKKSTSRVTKKSCAQLLAEAGKSVPLEHPNAQRIQHLIQRAISKL